MLVMVSGLSATGTTAAACAAVTVATVLCAAAAAADSDVAEAGSDVVGVCARLSLVEPSEASGLAPGTGDLIALVAAAAAANVTAFVVSIPEQVVATVAVAAFPSQSERSRVLTCCAGEMGASTQRSLRAQASSRGESDVVTDDVRPVLLLLPPPLLEADEFSETEDEPMRVACI